MRRALPLLVLVGALLVGCGQASDDDSGTDAEAGGGSVAATSITIEVRTDADAEPTTMTLECDPTGGDHPQAQEACDALASAGADVLEPVPADQACTMIYGGPQTATVKGTVDGADVDATFTRENGCEVDRWERLGTTFFDVPLQ
ncbi:subtilase-type protease inhibitor [Aeromicrobium sp. 50.2.37]|uniref:subtilase-type protease inhibitor n=1 Tax=Aeromicrobium sp. 50.2.37 TaxID=2969305 RepID=UPI00214FF4D6|nr:subtilase-type protease inhibitor [Aeromicrobium sp. 50.2.37]MCR4514838.1 subtilase-type protease inhibitor [Aeromicrobium sp. 50.2.37]